MLQDRTERTTLQANLAEFCRWTCLQTEWACQSPMSLGWDYPFRILGEQRGP